MKYLFIIVKGIAAIFWAFVVIRIVNLPHDFIINAFAAGTAKNNIPIGYQAELISAGIVFLAGVLASLEVSLLGGRQRKVLLIILTGLFLLVDLFAVMNPLDVTSIYYRTAIVAMVPLEVWAGYLLGNKLKPL